jgi:alcohol dehydrogenase
MRRIEVTTLDPEPTGVAGSAATMKALIYEGPGRRAWTEAPKPVVRDAGDAVVRITMTTICGTDLHIMKGDVPTVTPGRILGHEGIGIVDAVGAAVSRFRVGDRVLISCVSACGTCDLCRRGMYSHCRTGGWILGNTIDGTQAEYVRTPHADTSLYHVPADADGEALVMLSDILPTALECGVLNGQVQPGDTVAIVGAGPIGLAALLTARLYSPSALLIIDVDANRLQLARQFGATTVIDNSDGSAIERVLAFTNGAGVDVAIEAVGVPAAFDICQSILAPGGRLANIGVHGAPVTLHLEKLWDRNIAITTRLVDTAAIPMLMKLVGAGTLQPARLVTHRFPLAAIMNAYDVFGSAAQERALKVILTQSPSAAFSQEVQS